MTTGHYSFKDSSLSKFTNTTHSKVQETLYYSAYGIPELNITPTQY